MKRRTTLKASATALAAMLVSSKLFAGKNSASNAPMSFFDVVQKRRSVRNFKSDPIPQEHIDKILNAARLAPTSGNQQPWKFVVLQNKKRIEKLKEICIKDSIERYKEDRNPSKEDLDKRKKRAIEYYGNYLSAPAYVTILTDNDSQYPSYNHYDGPLAAANLLLAARALGYGTVFVTDSVNESITKKFFKIPDNYKRVCFTPIGVPVEWPDSPEKKDLAEFVVKENF